MQIGVPPDRIDVVSCGVSAAFRVLPRPEAAQRIKSYGLEPGYLFAVSGEHFSKNFPALLRAYAQVDSSLRSRHPLVVRIDLGQQSAQQAETLMRELGIHQAVHLLGPLPEEDLVALYNGAAALVHASIQEGFGLPVVEAMRCGTPVACSNTSAMPEAGGTAACYFDPTQPGEIAAVITAILDDPQQQRDRSAAGLQQSAQFSWSEVARRVLASYGRAVGEPQPSTVTARNVNARRPVRIAYWSPVGPQTSGVSDYSESLLERLKDMADVDVFVEGYQPSNRDLFDEIRAFDYRAFDALHTRHPYDGCIYQLGNSAAHAYQYPILLRSRCPGFSVLHDGTLFHMLKGAMATDAFLKEISYCEGPQALARAQAELRNGEIDDYGYPLLRRVIAKSAGIIAHSEFIAQRCRATRYPASVQVIPYGTEVYEEDGGAFQRRVRGMLGLPPDAFIFRRVWLYAPGEAA